MNRIDLRVERDYRLVLKPATEIQINNIRRELRKDKPLNIGFDMNGIVWFGSSDSITANHAGNWIDMPDVKNALSLFKKYMGEVGNPTHLLVVKEPAIKQLVIDQIIERRQQVYGSGDILRTSFGKNLGQYYEDWDVAALRREVERLAEQPVLSAA